MADTTQFLLAPKIANCERQAITDALTYAKSNRAYAAELLGISTRTLYYKMKELAMADVRDLFYHGVRQQVRRVLMAMGPKRIELGLEAFDDRKGGNSWANCFFGLAMKEDPEWHRAGDPEKKVMQILKIHSRVPVRIVWNLFDQYDSYLGTSGGAMTKAEFRVFIESVLDESRPAEVMALIQSLSQDQLEHEPEWSKVDG